MAEINNLSSKEDYSFLIPVAEKVLKFEGKDKTELSIVVVSEKKIKEINKKYGKKEKETDVLSFDYEDDLKEIFICPSVVRKSAKKLNLDYNKEIVRVLIHGVLHIVGYDHEKSKKEAEIMEEKTNKYLSSIKF